MIAQMGEVIISSLTIVTVSCSILSSAVVAAPQIIAASPNSSTIQLSWPPVMKAVFYALDIIMDGSGIRIRLNTTELSVTIPNLQAGTTYCTKGNAFDVDNIPGDDITVCQITRKESTGSTALKNTNVTK